MSGKKFTYNPPAAKPKRPAVERVVSERGRKELPPGTKGGENLKPDRHYEHKQHAFDSYCKKVLKYEAYNGYREISRRQKRDHKEIGMHAIRGGTIVGEHELIFAGRDEIVTIHHSARSKDVFAVGALNAAVFLVGQEPGRYSMPDMLG